MTTKKKHTPIALTKTWNPTAPAKAAPKQPTADGNYPALYAWLETNDFTQQDKIRSGPLVQDFIAFLVKNTPNRADPTQDHAVACSGKQNKEADLLFVLGLILYYREVKCNTNLDSEKMPATIKKIASVAAGLQQEYGSKIASVDAKLLNPAWRASQAGIRRSEQLSLDPGV